jgi:tetratricopeptide (TPR) repeat protein
MALRPAFVLLAVLPFAPVARAQPAAAPADPAAVLSRAIALQQNGDVEGAVAAYQEALRLGADSPVLRSNLGAAYARLGRLDEAVEEYRRALLVDGTNLAIRRNLALAYYKAGRLNEAVGELQAVVDAQPGNEAATLLLADSLFRMGQPARVVELLQPLFGRATEERAVAYLLGMALVAEGHMDRAQAAIDRVLRDDSPEAHVFLAAMYMRDDDCKKAAPEIRKALEANATLPLANFLHGKCLAAGEPSDWAGAIEAYRAELAVDPNHFEANLLLGDTLREGGRHDEALPYLARALRLRPDDLAAQFSVGAVDVALNRTQEALPLLERVAKAAPDHLQTHMQLAIVYHRLGRPADSARERQLVGKLQSEGENRFFRGVSESLARLLARPDGVAPSKKP